MAAVLAAVLARQRKAQVAGRVGLAAGLGQQGLPFGPGQAAGLEIGARPFAPVVEEALVVVGCLQRVNLAGDERVQLGQVGQQVGRQVEIHGSILVASCIGNAAVAVVARLVHRQLVQGGLPEVLGQAGVV